MKLMPRSTAVRMRVMLSSSSGCRPVWYPPRPMSETFSPVLPNVRYGISFLTSLASFAHPGATPITTLAATDNFTNSRRVKACRPVSSKNLLIMSDGLNRCLVGFTPNTGAWQPAFCKPFIKIKTPPASPMAFQQPAPAPAALAGHGPDNIRRCGRNPPWSPRGGFRTGIFR